MTEQDLSNLTASPEYEAFCRAELQDPYELLGTLRSVAPVHWSPVLDAWVVTSYEDVTRALRDPRLRNDRSAINTRGIPEVLAPTYASLVNHISYCLGFTDPPKHSRLRDVARGMLSPALAAEFRPWITRYVRGVLEEISGDEHVDLLDKLALRLPLALICEALGIPAEDMEKFHNWTSDVGPFAGRMSPSWGPDEQRSVDKANESWLALEDMFRRIIAEKKKGPADDLLTKLLNSADGSAISDAELIGLSVFFLAAGHGTARNLLASGLYLLLARPDEAEKLSRSQEVVTSAVEEVLRYESPIPT